MSAGEWCLIESDPGVFTELIREFGKHRFQTELTYYLLVVVLTTPLTVIN